MASSALQKIKITEKTVQAIETILAKGDRAEVIPVKDGVRVMRIRRECANYEHFRTK